MVRASSSRLEYKQVQAANCKILYIEGLKDYVIIFIEDEPHPILSLMSMKSLEEMLPASRFYPAYTVPLSYSLKRSR